MKPTIHKVAMGAKPDPYNFKIVEIEHIFNCTIIMANYPTSLTFGGNKLMLLKGIHEVGESLDPHFLDEEYAVVARFIPTDIGWKMARMCAFEIGESK